jgi:hypothetical protein
VDEELVAKARRILNKRDGVSMIDALAEIASRLPSLRKPATINRYASNGAHDSISIQQASEDEEEDVLREEKYV